ncbi:MAG: GntR family transcriptional regulator [Proteobacteria bacterium]|nr:GntR family transcriptional regulator [Pseudomonadota bacterium]
MNSSAVADAGGPNFQPVRTRRAFEAVCDQVRRQVADGTLLPGQRLPGERELAERFGISRSGVREALRSLELAGLVEARTGASGGFFIRSSGSDGVTQAVRDMVALGQVPTASVTEARIEVTNVALRLAAQRATKEELDAIEADIEHHAALFKAGHGSRNTRALTEFYRLLARATHNEVIVMLIDALSEITRTLLARIDPQPFPEIIQVRRKVLKHLRAGEPEKACAAMAAHFRNLNRYLEEKPWAQGAAGAAGTAAQAVAKAAGAARKAAAPAAAAGARKAAARKPG